nr:ASN_HP1_G0030840.mRNA.1.CDS.1 [Saccharomyces cerevisiae]
MCTTRTGTGWKSISRTGLSRKTRMSKLESYLMRIKEEHGENFEGDEEVFGSDLPLSSRDHASNPMQWSR